MFYNGQLNSNYSDSTRIQA